MKLRYKFLLLLALVPMALVAQTKKWDAYRAENGISLPTWSIKTNLNELYDRKGKRAVAESGQNPRNTVYASVVSGNVGVFTK